MGDEKKKNKVFEYNGERISVSQEEFDRILETARLEREKGLTAQKPTDKEAIKKEAEARKEEYKLAREGLVRSEGESDLDFKMRTDAARESRQIEEQSKLRRESEESRARTIEAEQKEKKQNILYEQGFLGETSKHTEIRKKLYALSAGPKYKGIEEDRQALRLEYHNLPYEMPFKPVFKKTIILQSDSLSGLEIISKDNGKHWSLIANIDYFKRTPILHLDPVTGKPTGYTYEVFNNSIYDFKRMAQPARVNFLLEEDMKPVPKIAAPTTPKKPYSCTDQQQEHRYIGRRCCVCGYEKKRED